MNGAVAPMRVIAVIASPLMLPKPLCRVLALNLQTYYH